MIGEFTIFINLEIFDKFYEMLLESNFFKGLKLIMLLLFSIAIYSRSGASRYPKNSRLIKIGHLVISSFRRLQKFTFNKDLRRIVYRLFKSIKIFSDELIFLRESL
jgi:hypothetical protein